MEIKKEITQKQKYQIIEFLTEHELLNKDACELFQEIKVDLGECCILITEEDLKDYFNQASSELKEMLKKWKYTLKELESLTNKIVGNIAVEQLDIINMRGNMRNLFSFIQQQVETIGIKREENAERTNDI